MSEPTRLPPRLALRCIEGRHIAPVDPLFVVGRLGEEDAAVMDVVRRGRCTKCSSR